MNIQDLRIFARVAAQQNLSVVASELGLATGTISKRVQLLEDTLKVRLFARTTRSIRMTEEGRKFLDHVERILHEIELAHDTVSASSSRPAGRLTISAPACLTRRIVAPALVGFLDAYPEIEVRVDITDRIVNLHEEGYDAAIRAGVLPDSSLKAKRLAADRLILVAAPAYLDKRGAPRRPTDLERHDCLLRGDQRTWTLFRGGEQTSVRVSGRLHSDSGPLLRITACEGAGILRTSQMAVWEEIASGRLVRVLPEYELAADAAVWALYPNAKHAMPRLRVLLDHLAEYCREQGAEAHSRAPAPQPVPPSPRAKIQAPGMKIAGPQARQPRGPRPSGLRGPAGR